MPLVIKSEALRELAAPILKQRHTLRLPSKTQSYRVRFPDSDKYIDIKFSRNSLSAITAEKVNNKYYPTIDSFGCHGSEEMVKDKFIQLVQRLADNYAPKKNIAKG